jgi:hypothetical protein
MSFGSTRDALPPPKKLGNLDSESINSNQESVIVVWMAGRRIVTWHWFTPAYNQKNIPVKQKVGKSDTKTVGYTYEVDVAGGLCIGGRRPVDKLFRHIIDEEVLWKNSSGLARDTDRYEPVSIPNFATTRIYWGYFDQPVDTLILTPRGAAPGGLFDPRDPSTWPNGNQAILNPGARGHYDPHPGYRNVAIIVAKSAKCRGTSMPTCKSEIARGLPWFNGGGVDSDDRGVNIAAIFYDWLTDTVTGRGLPESALHQASFEAERTALDNFRISPLITNQQPFRTYVAQLAEYADVWIRRSGAQLELGHWQRGDIDVDALPEVTDDDLAGEPDLTPLTWDDCLTKVTVKYCDRAHNFKEVNSEPYYNGHVFRVIGEPREETLSRLWITDAALANQYATEYGIAYSRPGMSGSVPLLRARAKALGLHKPGVLFRLNSATLGLSIVMRSTRVAWPADADGIATLTVQSERSIWPERYVQPPAPHPGNFVVSVPAIANARVFELPSGLKDSSAMQIAVLAQRPDDAVIGFRTHISTDNGTYDLAGTQEAFATFGKVVSYAGFSGGLNEFQVEIFGPDDLESQTDTQRENNTLLCFTGNEVVSVGQVQFLGGGLRRVFSTGPRYGATASGFPLDAPCWFILRSQLVRLENRNFLQNATRFFKFQPFTQGTEQTISSLVAYPYVFSDTPAVNSITNLVLGTDWDMPEQDEITARISATWDAVADVTGYDVGIKLSSAVNWLTRSVGNVLSTEWTRLLPGTSYEVRVRAFNQHGEPGLWSLPVTIVSSAGLAKPRYDTASNVGDKNDSQAYENPFDLFIQQEAGTPGGAITRWRDDAERVTEADGAVINPIATIIGTVTISARVFIGSKGGPQRTTTFSRIPPIPPDTSGWTTANEPLFTRVSGTRGSNGYKVKLYGRTAGGAGVWRSINGGAFVNIGPLEEITLAAGDYVEAYDTKANAFDSVHVFFYNEVPDPGDPTWNGPPGTNRP